MFEISRRTQFVLGGIVGLNLLVGGAAAAGVVPRPTETQTVVAFSEPATADVATEVADTVPEETTTTAPPETTVPSTTPPTTAPRRPATTQATTPPPTAAPVVNTTTPTTVAAAPTSTVPSRRNPSSAEVNGAIASLRSYLPLTPTEAQARQLGDMVCDAFDSGQSYAEVKATALQQVSQIPFVTVTPAAADAILRTAVQLFCPGHSSKLA
ncbi:MAG: DUF732 domain-containing protein [Acidimicrobiia bacterium]